MDLFKEKEIIEEAKKNPEVFGLLYDKYYQPIFSYVLKRTANIELSQDLTSQTFFKALTKLGTFRWQNVPFSSWLYRIAGNEIANYFRKNKYKIVSLERIPTPVSNVNPLTEIIEAEKELKKHKDFLKVREKLSKLPFKYQEVITLRFFEKKKIKEISKILGKREGTIKSLIYRGLAKLKTFIA